MKQCYIKLDLLERGLVCGILDRNRRELNAKGLDIPKQKILLSFCRQLSALPEHRSLFGSYYEWFLPGRDFSFILRELNAGRNRDIREGTPVDDINKILLKLERPRFKEMPGRYPQREACL